MNTFRRADRDPFQFGQTLYVYIDGTLYFLGSWGWQRWAGA